MRSAASCQSVLLLDFCRRSSYCPSSRASRNQAAPHTYHNDDLGFTIQYGDDMQAYVGLDRTGDSAAICHDGPIVCFVYRGKEYEGTGLRRAALAVSFCGTNAL